MTTHGLANKPLERAGINPRADVDAVRAGRSAPSRYTEGLKALGPMTTRVVEIAVHFAGDGTVRRAGEGGFVGGVVPPTLGSDVGYLLHRTTADSDGLLGPEPGEAGVLGSFQLNLIGTARGFRELGRYFLALAELDSSADPGHHQHFDDVRSTDGRTVVEVVIRKEPDRDGEPV